MTILREGVLLIEFALLIIYAVIMLIKKEKLSRLFLNLAFGLYLSVIIAVCFFPIRIGGFDESIANNFIPFKSIMESVRESVSSNTPYGMVSVLGNFVMLMPLGVFFRFYIQDFRRRLAGIFLFSVLIEAVQFIIGLIIGYNYRCIDIDDVILNTLGGIIAAVIFNLIINRLKKQKKTEI